MRGNTGLTLSLMVFGLLWPLFAATAGSKESPSDEGGCQLGPTGQGAVYSMGSWGGSLEGQLGKADAALKALIRIQQPAGSDTRKLIQWLKTKAKALKEVTDHYARLAKEKKPGVAVACLFKAAMAFEDMALGLYAIEGPEKLTPEQKQIFTKELSSKALPFEKKALQFYKAAVKQSQSLGAHPYFTEAASQKAKMVNHRIVRVRACQEKIRKATARATPVKKPDGDSRKGLLMAKGEGSGGLVGVYASNPDSLSYVDSALRVELSSAGSFAAGKPVELEFQVSNVGKQSTSMCTVFTPLESRDRFRFEVLTADGKKLEPRTSPEPGPMPGQKDWIDLEPGKAQAKTVDLREYYDLPKGSYTVRFRGHPRVNHLPDSKPHTFRVD